MGCPFLGGRGVWLKETERDMGEGVKNVLFLGDVLNGWSHTRAHVGARMHGYDQWSGGSLVRRFTFPGMSLYRSFRQILLSFKQYQFHQSGFNLLKICLINPAS